MIASSSNNEGPLELGEEPQDSLGTAARVIASGWTAFFLLLALGYAFVDSPNQSEDIADLLVDTVLMAVFLAAALGACVLSWMRPTLRFALFTTTGVAGTTTGVITAGENHWIAALVSGGPYFLAAAVAWFSTGSPRHGTTGRSKRS
jgi:hypothetical protein